MPEAELWTLYIDRLAPGGDMGPRMFTKPGIEQYYWETFFARRVDICVIHLPSNVRYLSMEVYDKYRPIAIPWEVTHH